MSAVSVTIIERNEASTVTSNPCVHLNTPRDKPKITKGVQLAYKGCTKQEQQPNKLEPIKGVSLLSHETSQIFAPTSTPRQSNEVSIEDRVCISQPLVSMYSYDVTGRETEERSLSVVGAQMNSKSSLSHKLHSDNCLRNIFQNKETQASNENETEVDKEYEVYENEPYQRLNSSTRLDTPDVPPSTPYGRPVSSLRDFKVDGMHINTLSNSGSRLTNSRDFIPGYVKRASYCCDKCEMRMVGHESLNRETASPFYAYQRQCYSRLVSLSDEMLLDEDYCNYDYLSYLHLLTKSESKADRNLMERSTSPCKHRSRSVASSITHNRKEKGEWSGRSKSCCPPEHDQDQFENFEAMGKQIDTSIERTVTELSEIEGREKTVSSSTQVNEQPEYEMQRKSVEFHRNCLYNIASETDFSKTEGIHNEKSQKGSKEYLCSQARESNSYDSTSSENNNPDESQPNILWKDTWNRVDTVVSPVAVPVSRVGSVCSRTDNSNGLRVKQSTVADALSVREARISGTDKNSNTMDNESPSTSANNHFSHISSERLHEILQECVDSLTNIHKRVTSCTQESLDRTANGFLPDIKLPTNDLCYCPVTDKRYNRWKRRRKRKQKNDRTLTDSESSSDEIESVRSTTPLPNNLRRRRRPTEDQSNKEYIPYDAGSEMTSSDVNYQPFLNNVLSDQKTKEITEPNKETKDTPSFKEEHESRPDAVDGELFSFPALNNYHSSITKRASPEQMLRKTEMDGLESTSHTVKDKSSSPHKTISENTQKEVSDENSKRKNSKILDHSPTFLKQRQTHSDTGFLKPRFPDSIARRTIFRLSHSIDEKLQKSGRSSIPAAEDLQTSLGTPVAFKSKRIYTVSAFKKSNTPLPPTIPSLSKSRPRRLTQLNPGLPLPDPDIAKPDLSSLTLSHLLMSMGGRRPRAPVVRKPRSNNIEQNEECDISPRSKKIQLTQKKKIKTENKREDNKGIDRRTCIGNRWSASEASKPPSSPRAVESTARAISNLSFTPAFTFSLFELPRDYKLENLRTERRAEM